MAAVKKKSNSESLARFELTLSNILTLITLVGTLVGFGIAIGVYIPKINKVDDIETKLEKYHDELNLHVKEFSKLNGQLIGAKVIAFVDQDTVISISGDTSIRDLIRLGNAFEDYSTSGTYTDTLNFSNGCDSTKIISSFKLDSIKRCIERSTSNRPRN